MQLETSYVSAIDECVQLLVESQSPSDIFKVLLKASQCAAPRGAIFLVRQGVIKGWGSIGYDENVAKAQRAYRTAADQGWLGELVTDPDGAIRIRSSGGNPDFGQAAPSDSAAIAVRIKGRTIAVLMTERSAGETLWLPTALSMFVAVAQLRLELDLALRKMKSKTHPAKPAAVSADSVESTAPVVEDSPPTVEPVASVETVQIASPDLDQEPSSSTEIDAVPETAAEDAEVTAARRFAKLVATDIRLYNEDAVMLGRREKDLADRLGDQLGRGKATFLKRHGAMGSAALEILHEAFVDVLAAGDQELLPVSVLD
jgi:hypothetical protein